MRTLAFSSPALALLALVLALVCHASADEPRDDHLDRGRASDGRADAHDGQGHRRRYRRGHGRGHGKGHGKGRIHARGAHADEHTGRDHAPGEHPGDHTDHDHASGEHADEHTGHDHAPGEHPDEYAGHDRAPGEHPEEHTGHDHAPGEHPDEHTGHDRAPGEHPDEHAGHDHAPGEHPLDPIAEVQNMLKQGRLDEAETLLDGLEGEVYILESLRGLLAMKRGKFERAITHFQKVLALKPNQTAAWLYLGQACFETEQYKRSVEALRKGRSAGELVPSYYRLLAKAELTAGFTEAGYRTLLDGGARFPEVPELQLDRALFLIEAGLYAAALEAAEAYLATRATDANGHAVMAEALRSAKRPLEAAAVLENALLKDPGDADLWARLGLCYSSAEKHLAAAHSFYRASTLSGRYHFETAEQFRLAGKTRRALLHNAAVADESKRLRQRLTILLAAERFDRAVALYDAIDRAGAWNDYTRYLLVHAHLRTGDLGRAETLYGAIRDSALRATAARMMQTVASLKRARQER